MSESLPSLMDDEHCRGFLDLFSDEILLHILQFVSGPDLASLAKVNHHLHALCNDETLWKLICEKEFRLENTELLLNKEKSWRYAFVNRKNATVWFVSTTMTVSEAIAVASDGDIIALKKGAHEEYYFRGDVHKRLEIVGDGPPGSVEWNLRHPLTFFAKNSRLANVTVTARRIVARRGCTEIDACTLFATGVTVVDCAVIANCDIHDVSGVGVDVERTGVATLYQNTITRCERHGVVSRGKGTILYENTISKCAGSGVEVSQFAKLVGNRICSNGANGVRVHYYAGEAPHFENNVIDDNTSTDLQMD